jgi:uncharacterized protein with von Willebrand factor type A (vWA) domain
MVCKKARPKKEKEPKSAAQRSWEARQKAIHERDMAAREKGQQTFASLMQSSLPLDGVEDYRMGDAEMLEDLRQ